MTYNLSEVSANFYTQNGIRVGNKHRIATYLERLAADNYHNGAEEAYCPDQM